MKARVEWMETLLIWSNGHERRNKEGRRGTDNACTRSGFFFDSGFNRSPAGLAADSPAIVRFKAEIFRFGSLPNASASPSRPYGLVFDLLKRLLGIGFRSVAALSFRSRACVSIRVPNVEPGSP